MERDLELQARLFETVPKRRELLSYEPFCAADFHVQVFRNHSFELIEHTLGMYLDYAGIGIRFSYSGYDDSLSFTELDDTADLILLWIDATRYNADVQGFLTQRVEVLRARYAGPILLIPYGISMQLQVAGVTVWNLDGIRQRLGDAFTDTRAMEASGSPMSGKAMLAVSRELGLRLLSALLRPSLKAIVVDLDNTLYRGVLGEDGIGGIELTDGHRRLQECLKALSEDGFFLCVASKNEMDDVKALFAQRKDFPLKWKDFSTVQASWDSKGEMVRRIAEFLNIHTDSMVFIDDNIGELAAVEAACPEIRRIHAKENADATCAVLKEYPGLLKLESSDEDRKRKQDIQAKAQREAARAALSPEAYIQSLGIQLSFEKNNPARAERVFELANKTNQFIFNYKRYTRQETEERINSPDYSVVTVSLKDKLSDSGLIGVCVGHAEPDCAEIEECFVSCRALGRGIDDMIVLAAINAAAECLGKDAVRVEFQRGPRNLPAEEFIHKYLEQYLEKPAEFDYQIPAGLVEVNGL